MVGLRGRCAGRWRLDDAAGVHRALELRHEETDNAMALVGAGTPGEIDRDLIRD